MWACMVNEWDESRASSLAALRNHAESIWESQRKRPEYCANLAASMPRRLQEVIDAAGHLTKY